MFDPKIHKVRISVSCIYKECINALLIFCILFQLTLLRFFEGSSCRLVLHNLWLQNITLLDAEKISKVKKWDGILLPKDLPTNNIIFILQIS